MAGFTDSSLNDTLLEEEYADLDLDLSVGYMENKFRAAEFLRKKNMRRMAHSVSAEFLIDETRADEVRVSREQKMIINFNQPLKQCGFANECEFNRLASNTYILCIQVNAVYHSATNTISLLARLMKEPVYHDDYPE